MRFVFLIPDFLENPLHARLMREWHRWPRLANSKLLRRYVRPPLMFAAKTISGGSLNIMRHCHVARSVGADAVMSTLWGRDDYGKLRIHDLPFIAWKDRRPDDVCILPDIATHYINDVKGPAIAYEQNPTRIYDDYNWRSDRVTIWTDSPFMLDLCHKVYPGKNIPIVPNIIDNKVFPFIPQEEREEGLLFAFPRKGKDYIEATREAYRNLGGTFWKFELVDGLTLHQLAKEFSRPQAMLASADIEGCALPPQESMASGMIVVGKNARGANFGMRHRDTAMIGDTPQEAAQCLRELEDLELRKKLSNNGLKEIQRLFPENEPSAFWRENLERWG